MASCHTHATCCQSSHRIHRIHRSFWCRISSHRIHRIHRSFWCRISSHRIHRIHGSFWCRIFSHGIHRIHGSFWCRIFSHGIHRMLGCVIGGVGMAGMPYPPNLCASVPICGRLSLPEGSVCSVYSVGHSICLLCWCCRSSCTSVVVFSHGFHGFPQMVRLRYWRRGYGRDAIPS